MESITALEHESQMSGTPTPLGRPLRVLHVASGDLWAGAEAQIYTLLRTLAAQFSDVHVVAALMNEGELAERLRKCGIEVHTFDESRLNSVEILMGLRRLMRSWRPDIVHTHRTKENILGALANRMAHKVPCVRTAHGANERARGLREMTISRLDLWCARNLQQRIIAVSADLARMLTKTHSSKKISVIENGVDIDEIRSQVRPVEFRTRAANGAHVGLAGRLVPVKRVDLFISMATVLQQRYPQIQWHFHVFGDGPLRSSLETQAKLVKGLEITFHGHRSDIIACLAALDVLVMCSDHEGMPMTALEALAVGTQIVAHAVGGLADVLAGVESGDLVKMHNPSAYAEAVWQALNHPHERVEASAIYERISATGNAAQTYSLYRELASFAM